jgi:hypothetical protein
MRLLAKYLGGAGAVGQGSLEPACSFSEPSSRPSAGAEWKSQGFIGTDRHRRGLPYHHRRGVAWAYAEG